MLEIAKRWWESTKTYFSKLGVVARFAYAVFAVVSAAIATISWTGWPVAMALLSAWLISSGVYSWGYALLAGLGAFALTAAGMAAYSRAQYYKAMTPKPASAGMFQQPSIPIYKPTYTTNEIKTEVLPALTQIEGILDRRCLRAVNIWKEIHEAYGERPLAMDRLRGEQASFIADQLEQSRKFISAAAGELLEVAYGHYQRELLPLIDFPGKTIADADFALSTLVTRLREMSKPSADAVDRKAIFQGDSQKLKELISGYGAVAQERLLVVRNRMAHHRLTIEEREGKADGKREVPQP